MRRDRVLRSGNARATVPRKRPACTSGGRRYSRPDAKPGAMRDPLRCSKPQASTQSALADSNFAFRALPQRPDARSSASARPSQPQRHQECVALGLLPREVGCADQRDKPGASLIRLRIEKQRIWNKGCGLTSGFAPSLRFRTPHRPGADEWAVCTPALASPPSANAGGLGSLGLGEKICR